MEKVTEQETRKLIIELKLSQTILELFDGKCEDEIVLDTFRNDYADPYAILCLTEEQQNKYRIDRYKPILAYAFSTIFAYDIKQKGFVSYYIELMNEQLVCFTWDGLFVQEILKWLDFEISDENILHIGNLFGLKYTKEILDSYYSRTGGDGFPTTKEKENWVDEIMDMINGRIK